VWKRRVRGRKKYNFERVWEKGGVGGVRRGKWKA
jgi:hypothetical protein